MTMIVLAAFDDVTLADHLADRLGGAAGAIESRRFPDEETYLRLLTPVADCDVILAGSLDRPDPKLARLVFLADAARSTDSRERMSATTSVLARPPGLRSISRSVECTPSACSSSSARPWRRPRRPRSSPSCRLTGPTSRGCFHCDERSLGVGFDD